MARDADTGASIKAYLKVPPPYHLQTWKGNTEHHKHLVIVTWLAKQRQSCNPFATLRCLVQADVCDLIHYCRTADGGRWVMQRRSCTPPVATYVRIVLCCVQINDSHSQELAGVQHHLCVGGMCVMPHATGATGTLLNN